MSKVFIAGLLLISNMAMAYSTDTGVVKRVFVNPDGLIAFQIEGGFTDAIADGQCPSNNGWAGHNNADSLLKSAILAAKVGGLSVTVTTQGCEGSWLKIKDMYVN